MITKENEEFFIMLMQIIALKNHLNPLDEREWKKIKELAFKEYKIIMEKAVNDLSGK